MRTRHEFIGANLALRFRGGYVAVGGMVTCIWSRNWLLRRQQHSASFTCNLRNGSGTHVFPAKVGTYNVSCLQCCF